jgi:hypothetical protein
MAAQRSPSLGHQDISSVLARKRDKTESLLGMGLRPCRIMATEGLTRYKACEIDDVNGRYQL